MCNICTDAKAMQEAVARLEKDPLLSFFMTVIADQSARLIELEGKLAQLESGQRIVTYEGRPVGPFPAETSRSTDRRDLNFTPF